MQPPSEPKNSKWFGQVTAFQCRNRLISLAVDIAPSGITAEATGVI